MTDPTNRNGYPLSDDLRETMASALGLDIDEGWLSIALTLMEQCVVEDRGQRQWTLPPEPGPEVTVLVDCDGRHWDRLSVGSNGWISRDAARATGWVTWGRLLTERGPLVEKPHG